MRRVSFAAIVIAIAFCSGALADDLSATVSRPALAGYCVQSLQYELSKMEPTLSSSCGSGITAQQCDEIKRPLRVSFANEKRTLDLWRAYGLSLGPDASFEFLRGVAEAKADLAYLSDYIATHPIPPTASADDVKKSIKAAAASDPRLQAIHDRGATCQRGPPL